MNQDIKKASAAHEILMMNLAIFHLLIPVVALSSGYLSLLMSISMIGSLSIITWIAYQAKHTTSELVHAHWQLAWKRCKLLLIAYAVSAAIMGLGWLIGLGQTDDNMKIIFMVVFSRIAVVPTIIMMMILFVLESSSLAQARQDVFPQ